MKTSCEGVHLSLKLHFVDTPLQVFYKNFPKTLSDFF